MTTWMSAHIYLHGQNHYSPYADRVLLNFAIPFAQSCQATGWSDAFFFVRYMDSGGPHIRLRLRMRDATHALPIEQRLRAVAENAGMPFTLTAYEPEFLRYGGPVTLAYIEDGFHASSLAAMRLLSVPNAPIAHGQRLGRALLLMTVLVHTFREDRSDAVALVHDYFNGYLRTVAKNADPTFVASHFARAHEAQRDALIANVSGLWRTLAAREEATETLDAYRDAMVELRSRLINAHAEGQIATAHGTLSSQPWNECVQHLLPSIMHMTNNRMGVNVLEEIFLAYLLRQSLQDTSA